ncbi:MAG: alcohol dehydrogenase catalytic domain-containing protein, partial [Oryzihumus sp.]
CATDRQIADGEYGAAPPGRDRLVLGHESLGRVRRAPEGSGFVAGDVVVGVVRRPDPVPCGACAHGEFDMCRNGRYAERGIKELDGYASEAWVVESDYVVRLDPALFEVGVLMEPTTVVAKAWDQVQRIGERSWFEPRSALVTGTGPIAMLAALLGVQRGLDVHVLGRSTDGPKPQVVRDLGATYHAGGLGSMLERGRPEIIIEATGAAEVIVGVLDATAAYGIVCLVGVTAPGHHVPVDVGAVSRDIVLENDALVGSVNANLGHYESAAAALAAADRGWLARLITRRVPLDRYEEAFARQKQDIKTVIDLTPAA